MQPVVPVRTSSFLSRAALACLALLSACSSPPPLIEGPTSARPIPKPEYVERQATGSIYQAGPNNVSLFSGEQKPHAIGDTLKVDISESLSASNSVSTDTSSSNSVKSVGPGAKNLSGTLGSIADMNATASGSNNFTGKGTGSNTSAFTGRLAAYVINVLPNGNMVVAGERTVAFNGGTNTMRMTGVVNPADIKAGNIVASADVVDLKLQLVGAGGAAESQERGWLQKLLTGSISLW